MSRPSPSGLLPFLCNDSTVWFLMCYWEPWFWETLIVSILINYFCHSKTFFCWRYWMSCHSGWQLSYWMIWFSRICNVLLPSLPSSLPWWLLFLSLNWSSTCSDLIYLHNQERNLLSFWWHVTQKAQQSHWILAKDEVKLIHMINSDFFLCKSEN